MPSVGGFWSYAHSDDENDEGRIRELAERLSKEYESLTGEKLELFIDEKNLLWGDDWRERIAEALERVTFFIPIITPTYFLSRECRKELIRFGEEARKRAAERLILPIYYIEVPELEAEDEPADAAMAMVKPLHREELRELRLESQGHPDYRRLVNRLALRIIEISREVEGGAGAGSAAGPAAPTSPGGGDLSAPPESVSESAEDEEEGLIDRMARGESSIEKLKEPLAAMLGDMKELSRLAAVATEEMSQADAANKPTFATRLSVAKKLAAKLEAPAVAMETHTQEYVSLLFDIDPFVTGLLDMADADDQQRNSQEIGELLLGLESMVEASRQSSEGIAVLATSIEKNTDFSRDLRKPLRRFQTSLRNIIDAQAVMDEWEKKAKELERKRSDAGDSAPAAS